MEDDEREVGWAPRKIRQLEAAKNQLFELVGQLQLQIGKLEADRSPVRKLEADAVEAAKAIDEISEELGGTDRAVARLSHRLSKVERTVGTFDQNFKRLAREVTEYASAEESRQAALRGVVTRVEGLERAATRRIEEVKAIKNDTSAQLEADLSARLDGLENTLHVHPFDDQLAGAFGGVVNSSNEYEHRPNEDEEISGSAYRRGYEEGKQNTQPIARIIAHREAEERIRAVADSFSFTKSELATIVAALWGETR